MKTVFSYEELASIPRDSVMTVREKDNVVKTDNWEGIRFDRWLAEQGWTDFDAIRFVSGDRYQMSLEKAEFDTLECWLVFSREGELFEDNSLRVIFPALRDMFWVRNLENVYLENTTPSILPDRFIPMEAFLSKHNIQSDPEPFKDIEGWRLEDLFGEFELPADLEVLFVSGDMIKVKLLWHEHLHGAILERYNGEYNLKSPRIPGGMWLKDIVYLQIGSRAWWRENSITLLPELDALLKWGLMPDSVAILHSGKIHTYLNINELMTASKLLGTQDWFELSQP